ncbi:MAG: type I-U CRISPR-associated helicase/endonuclease Cas3 [Tepidisphaeraceae bacterium]
MSLNGRGTDAGRAMLYALMRTERDRRLSAARGRPIAQRNLRRLLMRRLGCVCGGPFRVDTAGQFMSGMGMHGKESRTMDSSFADAFGKLTGAASPFPWQQRLYDRFVAGDLPDCLDIPTGLGKTSVIAIWLLARAVQPMLPRRLVYVVNRRTVIDQTTDEVERIRKNLPQPQHLAISTLRGQFADNHEWSADPSRPAVILGTVDMIGSRLLFSGYGIGFRLKPLHAGFLGQDTLIVHDEAHLEPAFQKLLIDIEEEQKKSPKDFSPCRVLEMSATSRGGNDEKCFRLLENEKTEPTVKERIESSKTIHLIPCPDEKQLPDQIAKLAMKYEGSGRAILVFLRRVEDVEKVVNKLPPERTRQLTGTLRGRERDQLVDDPIFCRFLPDAAAGNETVYLVCTSAGEVGVNISADHLVCDLSTFDSMAQRLGRVNRFGKRDDTVVQVVHPVTFENNERDERRKKTLDLLHLLNGDGNPKALGDLDPNARFAAFALPPTIPPVSDILFDAWAMTSIPGKLPGRPHVEPYLHGIAEWEPPETHVAWREEVGILTGELLADHPPETLLDVYPLKPHELLRDRSDRVWKHLQAIAARHPDAPVWLIDDEGGVDPTKKLNELQDKAQIAGITVLLPPEVGGLTKGLLDGKSKTADDVADEWYMDDRRSTQRRFRKRTDDPKPKREPEMKLINEIDLRPAEDDDDTGRDIVRPDDADENAELLPGRFWRWYEHVATGDTDGSKTAELPIKWKHHTDDVVNGVEAFVKGLSLPDNIGRAITFAAKWHDLGKRRELWQRSIGNPNPTEWYAKSGGDWRWRDNTRYRHEFGSLLDVERDPEFQSLDDDTKDLVLHLIAAHHGYGRPHFPPERAIDPAPPDPARVAPLAVEVPLRFARLQRRFGRWGLAYLESLLRAADYAASAKPSPVPEVGP